MDVKIHKNERVLSGFFDVDVATLQYEKFDGTFSQSVIRYNLERPEAVAVLIYLQDKDKLLLIRQFRYADYARRTRGWIDEIVAGVIDKGETPLACARRETIEETGYEIHNYEHIASVYSTPGITTELVHIYLGLANSTDLKHTGGGLDEEHEDIKLIELTRQEAWDRLKNKTFIDAKTILSLQYFFLNNMAASD